MWGFIKKIFERDEAVISNEELAEIKATQDKLRVLKTFSSSSLKEQQLSKLYGKELGTKIAKGELWIGMNKEALMVIKGKPGKKTETISNNKKTEEYFYDGKKNRQGNMSYKLKVILIDELVEKWAKS